MRIYEIITEGMGVTDGYRTVTHVQNFGKEYVIRVYHGDKEIAGVDFNKNGSDLTAKVLWVNKDHRGHGIAKMMYDYAKQKGFTIHRSDEDLLSKHGKHFWEKNRGEVTVWENRNTS